MKAITEFYISKIKEFTDFIPDEKAEGQIQDKDTKRKLVELRLDITGEAYSVSDMILGSTFGGREISYENMQERLKGVRIKLEELRKNYNSLLVGNYHE